MVREDLKQAMQSPQGRMSSGRINATTLVICAVIGFFYALVLIAYSTFSLGIIPEETSILKFLILGCVGTGGAGGLFYWAAKRADRKNFLSEKIEGIE
jgi:drug/metabolite transporter (DMT)-like permease